MALSFIGKSISLISHSDVRYRGILAGIDTQASTIQLSNVYSMGTEGRRPPNQFIAPVQDPYAYIIFRASEVKDLSVDEPVPAPSPQQQHNVRDDPAVIGVSGPARSPYPNAQQPANGLSPQSQQAQAASVPSAPAQTSQPTQAPTQPAPAPATRGGQTSNANPNTRRNPVHTAAASLETVERALGDLRVGGGVQTTRGGRRGQNGPRNGGNRPTDELKVPTTDFDFQSSNAKFDKPVHSPANAKASGGENGTGEGESEGEGERVGEKEQTAYNPQKSFFDSLSSSAATAASASGGQGNHYRGGGGGRRGGPGGGGRNRREEEREKNVATFGEPGGVGLLGPGSYVGGWGGYGRRGGRPRRGGNGGGRGGGNGGPSGQSAVQARG